MEQIQYQSYEQPIGFRPIRQPDIIPELDREHARQNRARQAYLAGLRRNEAVEVQNARQFGEGLQAVGRGLNDLAKFSTTLAKKEAEAAAEAAKQEEINATYDALTQGIDANSPGAKQEQQIIQQGSKDADNVSRITSTVEQATDDIGVKEYARTAADTPYAQGYRGEIAALTQARVSYSAWMSNYLKSNKQISLMGRDYSLNEMLASGDTRLINAAIASGRLDFIKQNNLQYATKTNFVKYLGNTIINADAQLAGAAARQAIKFNEADKRSELTGQGYNIGQTVDPTNVGESYRSLAESMWLSTAYSSRGEANEAALKAIIEGMVDRGDVDGLSALYGTEKIQGNAGSRLGSQYGQLINDAIERAEKKQDGLVTEAQEDIETGMYQQLAGIDSTSPDAISQRDAIIENTANQYEAIGEYKKARELRGQRDRLTVDGNNQLVNAELEQGINDGAIVDAQQIEQAFVMGSITRDQRNKRLAQLNSKTDSGKVPSNPIATKLINSYTRRWVEESGRAFGLKADEFGNYVDSLANETSIISPGDAAVLKGQVEAELRTISNQILRQNPSIGDQQLQQELTKRLQEWWTKETQSAGGAYRIDDVIKSRQEQAQKPQKDFSLFEARFKNTINGLDERVSGRSGRSDSPRDFSRRSQVDTVRREDFNPLRMDILFNKTTTKQFADTYQSSGVINKDIVRMADKLGMTPMALLQQQLAANGLEPVKPPVRSRQSSTTPLTSVQGAQKLMSYGFPVRGASWLSGNIAQESSWIGNREPWQDGANKAGGLVSWNGPRLAAIQQRFGRPISEITTEQQLQYMVEELKQPQYAEANRIFRNPYSTDRQLIRASKIYWGYGEEGNRYQYSRDIEKQLRRNGSIQNQGGKVYQPQSSSVPYINQRAALNGEGDRQCFSAVSTMVANGYGVSISYDDYNNIRSRYGDTTVSSAQTGALRSLGLNASVSDNGSVNELARLAQSGKPVGIGIQPGSGSGHWIAVVGLTPQGDFIVNDPYGQLVQQKGGGWKYRNSTAKGYGGNAGENVIYSREFLASVWVDRGAGTGRILRIS